MSEETTPTEETPPAEGTEEVAPEPASREDLAAAIKSIEDKIGTPAEKDPYDLGGEDDFGGDTGLLGDDPPSDTGGSKNKDALLEEIKELRATNRQLSTRSNLTELQQWIKDNHPNAFMPSVKRAVRNSSSIEVIKGIAKASNADYERGKKAFMAELGTDLETIKKAANIKFEETAAEQYGGVPVGQQGESGMDIKEFMEKIKTMDGKSAEALMDKVKLGNRNPFKGRV